MLYVFFFKQKTAYEMRISDWSSDVCSSDLWTGGPSTDNGAYGLYPVQVDNVLIEDSVVKGASDAGIYVGQSTNIIVRNNRAEGNVAGIEIENSTGADVYGNTTTGKTGGILVFKIGRAPV